MVSGGAGRRVLLECAMSRILRVAGWALAALAGLIALGVAGMAVAARVAAAPPGLGVRDGRLAPCPPTPNCVSTQAASNDRVHYMASLPLGDQASAAERVRAALTGEPRGELLADDGRYFHALFRSPTMGFPDDVEIYIDEAAGLIHFRAAARLGQSDLDMNRARMRRIGAAITEAAAQ